jgi:O-antigen/teichoic acid export membrane protein
LIPLKDNSYSPLAHHAQQTAVGTVQDFLASALSLPTGIITAAFLTRRLGPENYGLFTVAVVIVIWIELVISIGFNRAVIKFIVESSDWQVVASSFIQVQLLVGLAAGALLMLVAPYLAAWLQTAELTTYLRIFALDIPIYTLAGMHRSILIGRGLFGQRAFLSAFYWLSRMILVIAMVAFHPSVIAAIWALIATSTLLFIACRGFVKPPLFGRISFSLRKMWDYAWPLFFFTVAMSLFNRIDLLFVKARGGLPEIAGFYGAAKNLTIVPVLFAFSLTPLLLAKLTAFLKEGQPDAAAHMTKETMRLVFCLLPFAGMSAGAADEVVAAIYGAPFLPAGSFLAFLIFGALGSTMVSIIAASLIAADRPIWTALLTSPVVFLAPIMHYFIVPRTGAIGAAAITAVLSWVGAGILMLAIYKLWHVVLPMMSILRSSAICLGAYYFAAYWHTPGWLLLAKLPAISLMIMLAYFLTGEIKSAEFNFFRAILPRMKSTN